MNIILPTELKDYVYIIFLSVTAVLGILTYVNAKKTILQPVKTEVLKSQINTFLKLNGFIDENIYYLGGNIAFLNLVKYLSLIDVKYKSIFKSNSDINIMLKTIKGSIPCATGGIISGETKLPNGIRVFPILQYYKDKRVAVNEIYFDEEYYMIKKLIGHYIEDPFLPKSIIKKLQEIEMIIQDNIKNVLSREIEVVLNEQLSKFKGITNTKEIIMLVSAASVEAHNSFNRKILDIKPLFKEIKKEIREYLKIDNIFIK